MKIIRTGFYFVAACCLGFATTRASSAESVSVEPISVGWIGAMTGPLTKYASFEATQLAAEEINASGGIGGRPLRIIYEDGRGDGRAAVTAFRKLTDYDGVSIILGGHCSPESLAIAPLAGPKKVLLLASITTSPLLSKSSPNFFRVSPVSTIVAEKLATYALESLQLKTFALLHEDTDYARPVAEKLRALLSEHGAEIALDETYLPGETDFRAILTRLKSTPVGGLYLGVQSPESAVAVMRQLKELRLSPKLMGNEITGNAVSTAGALGAAFNGLVFAEPDFDRNAGDAKKFIAAYHARFHSDPPLGFWTAEAYDSVKLLASLIERCGTEVPQLKTCLATVKNFRGASGLLSIDEAGDGVREYQLKEIKDSQITKIP